jgi:hypothetical protein
VFCFRAESPEKLVELPSLESLHDDASESPLSVKARLKILEKLAEEQQELSELDSYPAFAPRLIYQHTNDGGDFFGVGISIPLPVWDKNLPEQQRVAATLKEIDAQKEILTPEILNSQINYLSIANQNLEKQLTLYDTKVISSFKSSLKLQENLFAEGRGDLSQIWQGLRLVSETEEDALKLWSNAIAARIKLSLLIGKEV